MTCKKEDLGDNICLLGFYIDKNVRKKFKVFCDENDTTMSFLLRNFINSVVSHGLPDFDEFIEKTCNSDDSLSDTDIKEINDKVKSIRLKSEII